MRPVYPVPQGSYWSRLLHARLSVQTSTEHDLRPECQRVITCRKAHFPKLDVGSGPLQVQRSIHFLSVRRTHPIPALGHFVLWLGWTIAASTFRRSLLGATGISEQLQLLAPVVPVNLVVQIRLGADRPAPQHGVGSLRGGRRWLVVGKKTDQRSSSAPLHKRIHTLPARPTTTTGPAARPQRQQSATPPANCRRFERSPRPG